MPAANPSVLAPLLVFAFRWRGEAMTDQGADLGAIIEAYQAGDVLALDEVVRRLRAPLLRLAACVLRDPVAAEDAFIESMTRLLPTLRTFDNPEKFFAYARRTVRNHCVDLLRNRTERDARRALEDTGRAAARRQRPGSWVEGEPGRGRSPEQALLQAEQARMLREAVDSLGEPDRSVVDLTYRDGLTHRQVAEQLGLSPSAVKRTLGQARVRLARRLRKGGLVDAS